LKSDRERSRSRKRDDGRRGSIGKGKGKEGVVDDDVVVDDDDDDDDEKVERKDGRGEGEDEVLVVDVDDEGEIIDRAAAIIASLSPAAAILCSELNTRDNEADNGASS
jgi:hypothetical protein